MKQKLLLATVIALTFSFATKAQIGKGSLWLGGGIGYNNSKSNDATDPGSKNQSFSVNPAIGKAIKDNTIAGIDVSYSHNKSEYAGSYASEQTSNSYGVGFFIRQYVPIINRLYIFGQGRAGFGYAKQTSTYNGTKSEGKSWGVGLNFYPGVSFAVNKKLQLETGFNNLLNIQYSHSTGGSPSKKSSFSAGASLDDTSSFFLGFRLLLNNKG